MKTKKMFSKIFCALLVVAMIATSAPIIGFATDAMTAKINTIANVDDGVRLSVDNTYGDNAGYEVYRKLADADDADYELIGVTANRNAFIDYTAVHLETYTYNVALNGVMSDSPATIERIKTPGNTVKLYGNGIKIDIEPVEGVKCFDIKRCVGTSGDYVGIASIPADAEELSFYDQDIEDGQQYSYFVRAYDNGYLSYYKTNTVNTFFSSPTALANVNSGVKISYQKVDNAIDYSLYRRTEGTDWEKIASTKPLSYFYFVDNAVESGTIYYYTVSATQSDGTTNYDIYGKKIMYLEDTSLFASIADDGIVIDFAPVKGADYYQILRTSKGDSTYKGVGIVYAGEPCTFTDTTAVEGESYTYGVRAWNNSTGTVYTSYFKTLDVDYAIFTSDDDTTDTAVVITPAATDDTTIPAAPAEDTTEAADDVAAAEKTVTDILAKVLDFVGQILTKLGVDASFLDEVLPIVNTIFGFVNNILSIAG